MRSEKAPLASFIMGVFYRRSDTALLDRSVASVLHQSFTDFELLVCDDGSTPKAVRLLDEYAAADARVRLIRPGGKFRLAEKLNMCLREARGSYIARMDDDDFSHPERLAVQLAALRNRSEIDFVGCNVNLCRGGECIGTRLLPELPRVRDFFFVQPFIHPALVFRREALLSVGGYSEEPYCELCEDYDLLLRLYAAGRRGMNLQQCLLDYSLPQTAAGGRNMHHRWNEAVTRYKRFREIGVLPEAFLFVLKPLLVGVLPGPVLSKMRRLFYRRSLRIVEKDSAGRA